MNNNDFGKLIVSLDFELFWGMQDCMTLEDYKANILGARKAIPGLLELFKKHNIHATWATVGFLFAESKEEIKQYAPSLLPTYKNSKLSTYNCLEHLGNDEEEEPCFFAESLLKTISGTPGMEIGSHTYSHYYCREEGQTVDQFEADMRSALSIANKHGYSLSSVVLPRNQCEDEYTRVLAKLGFTAFRDEEDDWIHKKVSFRPLMRALRLKDVYFPLTGQGGYHPGKKCDIWNFTGSRMYKPIFSKLKFMEKMKLHRIKRQMLHAAKNGLTFHLWWHPHNIGVNTDKHMQQLREIFDYYELLHKKYGMRSLNMHEMVDFMENT